MTGEKNSFGSFADLAKALGGGEDSGDTSDSPAEDDFSPAAIAARFEERMGEVRSGVRELIQSAGPAFGPMTTGPECYRDPRSEEMELLASFRIRTVFPERVMAEVNALPQDPDPSEFLGREDLREEIIFTIDGDDAKDYDDAIGITQLGDGEVEVSVHIADVGHYVRPDTALDQEALARATSVYVPDQVVPMLPEELSNHLCSLVPDRDRLAFSVFMVFDEKGQRQSYRVAKSVIRSKRRCTYRAVEKLLDGVKDEESERLEDLRPQLEAFRTWTRTQQAIRDRKGSLRMQSAERKFAFDEQHEVVKIYPSAIYFSQTLIEETALAANQAVGDFFKERDLPTIYRVHPAKDPEEVEGVVNMLAEHGIRVPAKDHLSGRDVGRLIREARRRPNGEALIGRIMGLVERAVYEVAKAEDTAEHWGLARRHYLHFTSPIRRYPDLIVHRWLHDVLSRRAEATNELLNPQQVMELTDTASHCSVQADLAKMVESALDDLKICQYMDRYVGDRIEARIARVSQGGLEIALDEHYVNGFIPARQLEGRRKIEAGRMTVQGRRGTRTFDEGERVDVIVQVIDFVRLQVILELDLSGRGQGGATPVSNKSIKAEAKKKNKKKS